MKKYFSNNQKGIGLIELLVAMAIIGLVVAALGGAGNFVLKINQQNKKSVAATFLAQEAMEAVRAVKEENWTLIADLTADAPYHPAKTGSPLKWSLIANAENISGFTRQITAGSVYRDANDDIVASGGALDPETKKITATISWNYNGKNYQTSLISFLSNWQP